MAVTRNDVARLAGVSPATVSYIVNNTRRVKPETRERVLEAIRELKYHPSAVARSLRLQKSSTLGLIIPDISNPYFTEVAKGIEEVAFENGYSLVLCHSNHNPKREMEYVDVLRGQHVAGVIWIAATTDLEPERKFVEHGIPVVVLDWPSIEKDLPSVAADNFRGGYLAAEHLINLGHRRIGFIGRLVDAQQGHARLSGYLAALKDHQLPVSKSCITYAGSQLEDGRQALLHLLDTNPALTAVVAHNDVIALGALRAAYERGLKVPQQLSVTGFDDIPQAAFSCPALTTIRQPKFHMGKRAVELLLDLPFSEEPDPESPFQVQLIVRESTGCAPVESSVC